MGTHEVWQGGVSDSKYMQQGIVFETLNEYLCTSVHDNKNITFTIVLDKGYRVVLDAWNAGGHFLLQQRFAQSDKHITTD
jgi:hypothetical protein